MSIEQSLKSGLILKDEVVEINLSYFVATCDFNLYAEAASCRFNYPDISMDRLAEFLVAIGRGFTLGEEVVDGQKCIVPYGLNEERDTVPIGDPVPTKDSEWVRLVEEESDMRSFMVDRYSPKPGNIVSLLERWPNAYKHLSSQQMAFTATLLDRLDTRELVFGKIQAATLGMSSSALKDFAKLVEREYARIRINHQIEDAGYTVIGRGRSEEGPAVLYTLGLYDSKEGRDILFITNARLEKHTDAVKCAASELNAGLSLTEVNEKLKFYWKPDYRYRLVIRNIKDNPATAFEYQTKELPVLGVFTLMV